MDAGGAALAHDGEVAGVRAGVGYGSSEAARVGQNCQGELGEHTVGVLATRSGQRWENGGGRALGGSG
jgi:hypothetical protein